MRPGFGGKGGEAERYLVSVSQCPGPPPCGLLLGCDAPIVAQLCAALRPPRTVTGSAQLAHSASKSDFDSQVLWCLVKCAARREPQATKGTSGTLAHLCIWMR